MAITPPDSPSSPQNYAQVAVQPMDIQAPLMDAEIAAAFDATNREMGAGFLYPQGPRQAAAAVMLDSPQGFGSGGYDINAGTTAGWPADVEPDVAGP